MKKHLRPAVTAAVILAAAALFFIVLLPRTQTYLVLSDYDSGKALLRFPVAVGTEFSIEFTHSINRTPVRDSYEIRQGGRIFNVSCLYYSFGTGVQTQLAAGESLRYEDGAMIISGIDNDTTDMVYEIRQNSTHVLRIGGQEIFLPGQFDRDVTLIFSCRRGPF